jgi:magnesium transporter
MTLSSATTKHGKLNIESTEWEGLLWLNIEKPSKAEMRYLEEHYPFHALELDDCLSRTQRPKIDEHADYLFLVLHFPVFDRIARVTHPSQVAIFIGKDYLISVHSGELRPLVKLFKDCQSNELIRQEQMGQGSGFLLYQILDHLVDYCFPILDRVIHNVGEVEDKIFSDSVQETVKEISILRRDLIALRRIIRPQMSVIRSLEHRERPFLGENLKDYFSDIGDHVDKIWDTLQDYKEVVEGLEDTNNSLTSNRINQVMRILTIISTIMLPLSVVSGIYGMNVNLPLERSPFAFAVIMGIMVIIIGGMLFLFRRQRWI